MDNVCQAADIVLDSNKRFSIYLAQVQVYLVGLYSVLRLVHDNLHRLQKLNNFVRQSFDAAVNPVS